mgnify:CR=1 FL=1
MKKVVLIGLGAVGLTYAVKLKDKCDLKILANKSRIDKFKTNPPVFNGEPQYFDYILPSEKFNADLIIISTKSNGLDGAIENIMNFTSENTEIISLINGVTSEEKISERYPYAKVLKSYFIGHSAVRIGNSVTQDGIGELVIEHDEILEHFLKQAGIKYSVPEDMDYSIWLKYAFNLFSNQTSAILGMNFGALKNNKHFYTFAKKIIKEVQLIAEQKGVKNLANLESDALSSLNKMCDEGKTSMLQDVLAKRPTESDIFAGEIIRLGQKYGISTPCNQVLYDLIKIKEEDNEHCIHSGKGRQ